MSDSPPPAPAPARRRRSSWIKRVVMFLAIGGALIASWGSVRRLVPLQTENRRLTSDIAQVTAELEAMQTVTSPGVREQLTNSLAAADRRLFSSQQAIAGWLETLREAMVPLALEADARFGPVESRMVAGKTLEVVPLTLDLRPTRLVPGVRSPYQRVLDFCQRITDLPERADFVELTVTAGTNSVDRATAVLELWVKSEGT